jgi:hypothetical protein
MYIAANHSVGESSTTFKLINKIFTDYNPNLIIVEGVQEKYGLSPDYIKLHIKNKCLKTKWLCSEGMFARILV